MYVDNKKFYDALVEYKDSVKKAESLGEKRPIIPDYIGRVFLDIATRFSHRSNFINYTYREDMISDGVENCLRYIDNFDPNKGTNPFSYFTQIVYYAFLRRIQKEKGYLYTKYKLIENVNLFGDSADTQDHDRTNQFDDSMKFSDYTQDHMANYMDDFENHKKRKRVVIND